jgi:hypothetical protein
VNIDRIVLTTFPGYYFSQIFSLRSIQQYASGYPIDIIVDDFDINYWPSYVNDCQNLIQTNFPNLDIVFHRFSDLPGMERVQTGGWFRQQLVKLQLNNLVQGNNWLVVDADVEFLGQPCIDKISGMVRPKPDPIDIGNRLYVQHMLDCDQPWVVDEQQYWCLSTVPFRYIPRDLLQQLQNKVENAHQQSLFELHLGLFESNQLVAYDPQSLTMVMSDFQLIEVFRHRYYHTPLPIGQFAVGNFSHSSTKDWQFDRSYFQQRNVSVSNREWELSQLFGKHRA